jgi:hypothetical protein
MYAHPVEKIIFSDDGSKLAYLSRNGNVFVFNVSLGGG